MKNKLSTEQSEELLKVLQIRFENNMKRHTGLAWDDVQQKLEANPAKLWSLDEMERTEGDPDVVGFDEKTGEFIFFDCSPESPKGRRSLCFDHEALEKRKEHKPAGSAVNMAKEMGILTQQSENVQAARQIRFTSLDEIKAQKAILKTYIYQAIEIEKAGLKVQLKNTSEFEITEEFQQKLDENKALETAFNALTPGRQRAYLLYFSSPKQSKTRASRVENMTDQILQGKGLKD